MNGHSQREREGEREGEKEKECESERVKYYFLLYKTGVHGHQLVTAKRNWVC